MWQLEICKGVAFLKQQQFERAIEVLRNIERKGTELHEQAANNLSFLYFLEGDLNNAKKYLAAPDRADSAILTLCVCVCV